MNRRASAFTLLGLAGGLFASLVLAEAALRLVTLVSAPLSETLHGYDPMAVQIEPMGKLGYRQRPNSVLHYRNGTTASSNSLGYRGPEIRGVPSPGTVRVVLLGGSTTHGFGVRDDQTIDTSMRQILASRHPGLHFEVVNLAFDGYDSYELLERFRLEGVALQPQIVIFNEGINDVRNAWFPNLKDPDPRTLLWGDVLARLREEQARGGPTAWTLLKHYSYLTRIPAYIRDLVHRRREQDRRLELEPTAESAGPVAAPQAGDDGPPPFPDAAELFEKHVRELTALAFAHGVEVILSTPPSDLRNASSGEKSTRSYWLYDAQMTQRYRDELAHRLSLIARQERGPGHQIRYVAPIVPRSAFLDDCHLTADGNRLVATAFSDEVDSTLALLKSRR